MIFLTVTTSSCRTAFLKRGPHIHSGRWIAVAKKQGEDVILSVVSGLGDQAEVGGVSAAICVTCSLLISVRPR